MLKLRPLDPTHAIDQQLGASASPVVLINLFTVAEADVPALLIAWEKDALWDEAATRLSVDPAAPRHRRQLHVLELRAVGLGRRLPSRVHHPDFSSALAAYPSSVIAQPHLFAKVAVPNVCAA